MKLSNLSKILILISFIFINVSYAENEIDIWKNKKGNKNEVKNKNDKSNKKISTFNNSNSSQPQTIEVTDNLSKTKQDVELYGLYDPDQNNFTLSMWSETDGNEIDKIMNRINKLNLSKTAESIFIKTILSYSHSPNNLNNEDFLKLKLNWMINNNKDSFLEEFVEINKSFKSKKKIIQYLVDKNISKANLKEGCKKVNFIDKEIKDTYLDKFKIYCLIFNDKKNQAQLLFDILRDQGASDKFFDKKINFLLGLDEKPNQEIKDDNLLNFYLSSITVQDFKYKPTKKTKKEIWEYLNAANLIEIEDIEDQQRINELEIAAKENRLEKSKIFSFYKRINFDLNSLINAEDVYQTLSPIKARALIYQRYLLSDNDKSKIRILFLLKDLFKKDNLTELYVEFLSNELKKFKKVPEEYQKVVERNIISSEKKLGRVKYDDKILHTSRVVRFLNDDETPIKKTQKDFDSVYKKIKRNKKYFFSAKDLSLVESLVIDGVKIPKELDHKKISKKYSVPSNLLKLAENKETGFLALKIVEIIGEDEVYNLDPETIYFITNLLNKVGLIKFRNQILSYALPLRV